MLFFFEKGTGCFLHGFAAYIPVCFINNEIVLNYICLCYNIGNSKIDKGDAEVDVSKISSKGQIVIPAALREKYGLKANSLIRVMEMDGHIAVIPIPEDPIKAARGMLRGGLPAGRHMAEIRAEEQEIESKKRGRN